MTSEEARQTARFLRAHPPFDALAADAVERVAAQAELESYSSGDVVFGEGAAPVRHLRVIRSGVVELATRGRVLDMLVEGDVFGHGSLLSGLPTAFSARAVEDSTCSRIPGEEARGLLFRPRPASPSWRGHCSRSPPSCTSSRASPRSTPPTSRWAAWSAATPWSARPTRRSGRPWS